jgi:Domain of unknown function (DUF4326)
MPKGQCVKVKHLRPAHANLREWCKAKGNILVTRQGRVFIARGDLFHYGKSQWCNPFTLKEHSLDESLRLFAAHLDRMLKDKLVRRRFVDELGGADYLGCFCEPHERCHRDILIDRLNVLLSESTQSSQTVAVASSSSSSTQLTMDCFVDDDNKKRERDQDTVVSQDSEDTVLTKKQRQL